MLFSPSAACSCVRAVLPVNLHGRALVSPHPGAPPPSELMLQTLSNLEDASHLLWVPFGVAYAFCAYTCWLLRLHFRVGGWTIPKESCLGSDIASTELVAHTWACPFQRMDATCLHRTEGLAGTGQWGLGA